MYVRKLLRTGLVIRAEERDKIWLMAQWFGGWLFLGMFLFLCGFSVFNLFFRFLLIQPTFTYPTSPFKPCISGPSPTPTNFPSFSRTIRLSLCVMVFSLKEGAAAFTPQDDDDHHYHQTPLIWPPPSSRCKNLAFQPPSLLLPWWWSWSSSSSTTITAWFKRVTWTKKQFRPSSPTFKSQGKKQSLIPHPSFFFFFGFSTLLKHLTFLATNTPIFLSFFLSWFLNFLTFFLSQFFNSLFLLRIFLSFFLSFLSFFYIFCFFFWSWFFSPFFLCMAFFRLLSFFHSKN